LDVRQVAFAHQKLSMTASTRNTPRAANVSPLLSEHAQPLPRHGNFPSQRPCCNAKNQRAQSFQKANQFLEQLLVSSDRDHKAARSSTSSSGDVAPALRLQGEPAALGWSDGFSVEKAAMCSS